MGLTKSSVGKNALSDVEFLVKKQSQKDKIIALAGNPNVGKSTVFNGLTGMNQHTGNWPGKTVTCAQGRASTKENEYIFVDLPGTYSLLSHSQEEEVARNFLCFCDIDAVVVVCDATCLERNLNLALQIREYSKNVILCVNLLDEAKRKGIKLNLKEIKERAGVPVIGICAHKKGDIKQILDALDTMFKGDSKNFSYIQKYDERVEDAISIIKKVVDIKTENSPISRQISLSLLEEDKDFQAELVKKFGKEFFDEELLNALEKAHLSLLESGLGQEEVKDLIVRSFVKKAEEICKGIVTVKSSDKNSFDRKADRILTGRKTGYPIMLFLLMIIFWITITGANYPSEMLSYVFGQTEKVLISLFSFLHFPDIFTQMLVFGIWRVLSWVVSVMLPPMAIFFPLFTILEDIGYLPRVAYNLDKPFRKCNACGKQALTMCMGLGCNAAGVVGARIIDSPRERYLAILTNSFVPCNGRFPTLIAIISMFFIVGEEGFLNSVLSAIILTLAILLSVAMTFLATKVLSNTILKGKPSSFTLELPPFRKPQYRKILIRSVLDRTIFVLGRAVLSAVPAGLIIWILANVTTDGVSLLNYISSFLDPLGRFIGLDGVILLAFVLGLPANEIVFPIIIMAYASQGTISELPALATLKTILIDNGWTMLTAINTILFSLMHWPCATTLMTIKKETGSLKWTILSAAIPTTMGIILCMLTTFVAKIPA